MKYLILLIVGVALYAEGSGFVFAALIHGKWDIVVHENNKFKVIKTELEPRTFDYDFINNRVVYIASDETLRLKNVGKNKETILLRPATDAYTEPMFTPNGKKIIIIKLINGNSTNTDIISLNLKTKKIKGVVTQRSTQLEPYILNDANLYYSDVSCVEGCGKIIQEVWYKHLLSGDAYQLTLTNCISHQPSADSKQENIYFSSNKNGYFHIWKMSLITHKYTQLTTGDVTDGYPMPIQNSAVLFIRKIGTKSKLMKLNKDGKLINLKLPREYTKIRNLKVQR
jgi:hypothetical protein